MKCPRVPCLLYPAVAIAIFQLSLTSCSRPGPEGPSGAFGEWVQGNGISLMVRIRTVDGLELPGVEFDNRSDAAFPVVPLKCSAWYEGSGLLKRIWPQEERTIHVEPRGKLDGFFTVDLSPKKGDRLLKVVLKYGPTSGEEFTFVRK
jgi:hypothetical protein